MYVPQSHEASQVERWPRRDVHAGSDDRAKSTVLAAARTGTYMMHDGHQQVMSDRFIADDKA